MNFLREDDAKMHKLVIKFMTNLCILIYYKEVHQ